MARDVFGFHVPRVCRIRAAHGAPEDSIPRVTEAFRTGDDEVVTEVEHLCEGALALPSVIAVAGAMVVLGEPGAGKTSVLRHLTSKLPRVGDTWDPSSDACLWVSGGDLTENSYLEELGGHLESLPPEGGPVTDAGVLWVVLDQADESSLRQRLPRRLKKSLRGRDASRLRFLMACRTADYPQALTSVLSEALGSCWCVDLVPLSRKEAVALADSANVPGEELVTRAEEVGAAVLAGVPLTLELLVLTYRVDGRLHGTPQELFARGVTYLAEDHDQDRESRATATTVPQRLTVAGRIAAWMMLSGHRAVWRGRAFEAGPYDLEGGALADGQEQTQAGAFDVTLQAVEETLATALFTAPDQNRVEFRHSSMAAYLAARYLTDRGTTHQQLENLFLVGHPDGETASIPAPLRETAAWLVAMNPTATNWLAAADPESLAVHSSLVRSDEVRRLTVSRLLECAAQVELSDTRWQLSRWDLGHPLFADQLADVLETAPREGAADWQTTARIRLAIKLAQKAGAAHRRLADTLLRLVENDAWHQTERRLAARAAFTCGEADRTVPVLTRVLASLAEPSYATRVDPDHDLRGTLLTILWPDHLDVASVLAALRPPSPGMYGNYAQFLGIMPSTCPDEHLGELLAWTQKAVLGQDPSGSGFVFSPHRLEASLIDSVIDRTLRSEDVAQHLSSLAKIILGLLREHRKVRLPDCLQPDALGREPAHAELLRRFLTDALVREAVRAKIDPRVAAYLIVNDWDRRPPLRWYKASLTPESGLRYQLVGGEDFRWVLDQVVAAASGDNALVAAYGELAACLFSRGGHEAFELAYDDQHPAWPYMRPFYEPITLDSTLAQSLRASHEASNGTWPERGEFLVEQRQLLAEVREGNNDSLWRFLWNLRVDPQTGSVKDLSGPISTWSGAVALESDLSGLHEIALHYLTTEHDHADSWLQQSQRNKRSWAGYALLVELHSCNRIAELPPSAWSSWTAAILTEILGMSTSFMEPVRIELLRLASLHAAESLAKRMIQLTSAALSNAQQPIELNNIDPRWATELRTAMEHLVKEISFSLGVVPRRADSAEPGESAAEGINLIVPDSEEARTAALHTWHSFLNSLLSVESRTAYDLINSALGVHLQRPLHTTTAVLAAQVLLTVDAESHWPRIKALAESDAEFGRRLAEGCARTEAERIQSSLDEAGVADLYLWLSSLYAPEQDENIFEVRWVSAEQQAREWRDRLLRELSQRATADAVHELRKLAAQYPDRLAVAAALVSATKQHAAANWSQVRPEDVMRVLQDPSRRVIRTSVDLIDVVEEILEEVGRDLASHGELLWDRTPGRRFRKKPATTTEKKENIPDEWRPKPESALCAYLAHELNLRLAGHRVAVNREVLIRPTDPYGAGDRSDILIEALASPGEDSDAASGSNVKLVIEVKGSWNDDVLTAQEEQLSDRYLPEARTDAGIFLVGWYPIELWDAEGDKRRTQARKLAPDTLLSDLQAQALRLSHAASVHLRPLVLTVPRPHKT